MLKEIQLKVILILLDNSGHAEWNLAKYLDVSESYLSPILKELSNENLIHRKLRVSTREVGNGKYPTPEKGRKGYYKDKKKRKGIYWENPYYISTDLNVLGAIIRELTSFQVLPNPKILAGFILKGIFESKYAEELINAFGQDAFIGVAKDELGENYDYFIKKFFKVDLRVAYAGTFIAEEMTLTDGKLHRYICEDPVTDLEHWYCSYVSIALPEELPYLMSPFTVIRSKRDEVKKLIEVLKYT